MNATHIFGLLIGRREAILTAAASRRAWLLGAVLVLSASLARNYDGAYLPKEWPTLLHGLFVSTGNSFVLYVACFAGARRNLGTRPQFWYGYAVFLSLFWLTSPMAWLYAIPYETFLDPLDAARANLFTLVALSIWRVALMTRFITVLWRSTPGVSLCVVLGFCIVVAFAGLFISPLPLIDFMGGLRLPPAQRLMDNVNFNAMLFITFLLIPGMITLIVGVRKFRGDWAPGPCTHRMSLSAWALPLAAFTLLGVGVAIFQPQQRLRHEAEELFAQQRYREGLELLSAHAPTDFPAAWASPLVRLRWTYQDDTLKRVQATAVGMSLAPWVRSLLDDPSQGPPSH